MPRSHFAGLLLLFRDTAVFYAAKVPIASLYNLKNPVQRALSCNYILPASLYEKAPTRVTSICIQKHRRN